jgi:Domain of unknown function (DUF202)
MAVETAETSGRFVADPGGGRDPGRAGGWRAFAPPAAVSPRDMMSYARWRVLERALRLKPAASVLARGRAAEHGHRAHRARSRRRPGRAVTQPPRTLVGAQPERTTLAWVRTDMALAVAGALLARFAINTGLPLLSPN